MELHEINEIIKSLPEKHKDAILKLIDIKTNEDMKEVIQTIKHLENRVDSQINRVDSQIKIILWVLGIIITLIVSIILKMFL
ncbi:hypothetical protein [Bergeyella cardium]|uniref:Uncharacterized protein n=1 Tax=Bergeyella cardium TaxID=1585976 RepID=A0A6P1QQS8_9FLAO|nr:hypothetical protein [Bergeyella cardium]QHN64526.1 hypothetical protein DBX24_00785 [Bergeyella cardium]WHE33818.1 hypothetical protein P8603_00785 [Bergeyella cardium]WHF60468.1 hypothetical protein O0R51_00785 [Bergeyella cardium]